MEIWLLLIDHNLQVIGDTFPVDSTGESTIHALKERVKEERLGASRTDIIPADLTVWRCIDPTSFNFRNRKVLAGQISDVFSNERVESLGGMEAIAELNISKNEILFVKLPGQPGTSCAPTAVHCVLIQAIVVTSDQVGSPITLQAVREYEHRFLKASSKGGFTEGDIRFNGIRDRDDDDDDRDIPEFVKKYKQMLARKRKVADNVRCVLSYRVFNF
ncbi:hypothetical protein EDB89DRAFT_1559686 [Lactarius sanguifluus]|nr:hypothetical protein EDB89DRAFT_1559686 [Lactarius sanguifluus]